MSPSDLRELGGGIDVEPAAWLATLALRRAGLRRVLLLPRRLYDDRKDRSVLFWKSLPISDRDTVLSKVLSADADGPASSRSSRRSLTMFGFLMVLSLVVLLHGGNPFTLLWGPASPLKVGRTPARLDPDLRTVGAADRGLADAVLVLGARASRSCGRS